MQRPIVNKPINLDFLPEEILKQANEIFDRYFALGLNVRQKYDGGLPMFPNQISSLDSNELANIHSQYTAWLGYVADKLKYVTVASNLIDDELKSIIDTELAKNASKSNLKEKEAVAKSTSDYKIYRNYDSQLKGLKLMLTQEVETLDKQMMSLAREIKRRENYKD